MPTKTKRDEHKWERAQEIAKDQGHGKDWAYVMGIYKKMKPDYEFKSGPLAKKASSQYTVYLFSEEGDTLWSKSFPARDYKDAERKGHVLVQPVLRKFPDAEDWVVEEAITRRASDLAIRWLLAEERRRVAKSNAKVAAATSPYVETEIDGVRVVQVNTDSNRSKAQIQGNKILIKWGLDAPPNSSIRTKYLPKWVAWAKKKIVQKSERIETKKDWSRTNVGGYSVYDLEGKEEVAKILAKIQQDVKPLLREFGLSYTSLKESVAEGSLGFNRGRNAIALNVRQKRNPMLLRKYSAIMATMLHELAHIRHMNHGLGFKLFEAELVDWARKQGIYSPGRTAIGKSNAKVVETPNSFHPVKLEPPKAKRKEHPFEGFIDFQGIQIDVENAKGTTRRGTGPEGDWETHMFAHYGEIRGTEGTDGDKLDVYVGDNHDSSLVVVVHQQNPFEGGFDEDKVVLGCESVEEAIGLFKKQYDRPGFFKAGEYLTMPIGAFWRWVNDTRNKGKKVKASQAEFRRLNWKSVGSISRSVLEDASWVTWESYNRDYEIVNTVARLLPDGRWDVQRTKWSMAYDFNKAGVKPKTTAQVLQILRKDSPRSGTEYAIFKPKAQETPKPPPIDVERVVRALSRMGTSKGRLTNVRSYVPGKDGFKSYMWDATPDYRQRADHYSGGHHRYRDYEEDDGGDWDAWHSEYAEPLRAEVQKKLDAEFGGKLKVQVDEKGFVVVTLK